jgi:hypothetical protein
MDTIMFTTERHWYCPKPDESSPLHPIIFNLYEPCVLYIGRAHRYPPNTPFYIFFQQIYVLNFLNMLHTLSFFLFKLLFIS